MMLVYTEKETSRLYEVQLFEDFTLVRLLTMDAESRDAPEKLDLIEFDKRFDEFWGDSSGLVSEDSQIQTEPKD